MADDQHLDQLLRLLPLPVAIADRSGRVVTATPSFLALLGLDERALNRSDFDVRRLSEPPLVDAFRRATDRGETVIRTAMPVTVDAVRTRRVVDVKLIPLTGPKGAVTEVVVLLEDATSRVPEGVRTRLFHEAFLQSTNAMEVTDREGVIEDVNPAFERIYGFTRGEVIGKRPNIVASPKTPREVHEGMWKALLDPKVGHWSGEIVNQSKDGVEHPVLLSITPVQEPGQQVSHYIGVAVDLSERRAWEQQAVHSERLASIGQLAAGVAHELNTPLANIMLVAESVQRKTKEPMVRERMATIVGQTESAARIVRGLLDFSRRHEPQIRELNLSDVVRDAIGFLKGKQSEDVEVSEEYARGRIAIRGDRDQLIQVVTNILNNGYEAMEGQGSIHVRVSSSDGVAEVTIQDSGPGIPPSVLPHIFEPFFTTKADRNGTGLGLAICHGIVQAHGGQIRVETEPGHGARFTLQFPLVTVVPSPESGLSDRHPPRA